MSFIRDVVKTLGKVTKSTTLQINFTNYDKNLFGKLPHSRGFDTCLRLKQHRVRFNEGERAGGKEWGRNKSGGKKTIHNNVTD